MKSDDILVVPERGAVQATARALLALARDPAHVRTTGGGNEFLIPPYLADLYTAPEPEPTPPPKRRVVKTKKEGDE